MHLIPTKTLIMVQLIASIKLQHFHHFVAIVTFSLILSNMDTIVQQYALALFCLLVLMQKGYAYEFIVGGQKGWSVPSDPNANPYNQWAEKSRFQVGDTLGEFLLKAGEN
jgi:hypothetical protein